MRSRQLGAGAPSRDVRRGSRAGAGTCTAHTARRVRQAQVRRGGMSRALCALVGAARALALDETTAEYAMQAVRDAAAGELEVAELAECVSGVDEDFDGLALDEKAHRVERALAVHREEQQLGKPREGRQCAQQASGREGRQGSVEREANADAVGNRPPLPPAAPPGGSGDRWADADAAVVSTSALSPADTEYGTKDEVIELLRELVGRELSMRAAHYILWRKHGGDRDAAAAWLLEHGVTSAEKACADAVAADDRSREEELEREARERRAAAAAILRAGHDLRAEPTGDKPKRPGLIVPYHDGESTLRAGAGVPAVCTRMPTLADAVSPRLCTATRDADACHLAPRAPRRSCKTLQKERRRWQE